VTDVLKKIGRRTFAKDTPIKNIITVFKKLKIVKQGIIEQVYTPAKPFNLGKTVFTSHGQLDEYMHKLLDQYVAYNNLGSDQYFVNYSYEKRWAEQDIGNDSGSMLITISKPQERRNEYGEPAPRKKLTYARNKPLTTILDEFKIDCPLDFAILKSYDRAYWWQFTKEKLKAKSYNREPKYDPCTLAHKDYPCPFQDPALTGSIPLAAWNKEFDDQQQQQPK